MIRDLQMRLAETGRIRLGTQDGNRATKLDTFRFTSPFQQQIQAIAQLYGGTARPWQHPSRGPQFEVITEAIEIPVYVPPQDIDPWYEAWGNGFCTHRCDGVYDQLNQSPCVCTPDNRRCKPTVRIQVILQDVPGVGQWRLDSHGENAVAELYGRGQWLRHANQPVPGTLRIRPEERRYIDPKDNKPKTLKFQVPVLDFDWLIPRQVFGGQIQQAIAQQIAQMEAVGTTPATAVGALPAAAPAEPLTEWLNRIDAAQTRDDLNGLWKMAGQIEGLRGPDGKPLPQIRQAFQEAGRRADEREKQHQAAQPAATQPATPDTPPPATAPAATAPTQPDPAEPIDADTEPDRDTLAMQILVAANARGMDTDTLELTCREFCGKGLQEANGWELNGLYDTLR